MKFDQVAQPRHVLCRASGWIGEWKKTAPPPSKNDPTLSASHSPEKIVLIGPVRAAAKWSSVIIRGTSLGTPSSRQTCKICFVNCGSSYSDFQVIVHGSYG